MGRPNFTIYHAFAASLILHAGLVILLALHGRVREPDEQPVLVIELQGLTADSQAEQKVREESRGEASQNQSEMARATEASPAKAESPDNRPAGETTPAEGETGSPSQAMPAAEPVLASPGADNVKGVKEYQAAQRLDREVEVDRLREYLKLLTKKIQTHLVYPEEGRRSGMQGIATVSFAILRTGQIRPESLKIVASSGQPKLDTSALKTILVSVPFDPPPREMTVAIAVAFGRKARK